MMERRLGEQARKHNEPDPFDYGAGLRRGNQGA